MTEHGEEGNLKHLKQKQYKFRSSAYWALY